MSVDREQVICSGPNVQHAGGVGRFQHVIRMVCEGPLRALISTDNLLTEKSTSKTARGARGLRYGMTVVVVRLRVTALGKL